MTDPNKNRDDVQKKSSDDDEQNSPTTDQSNRHGRQTIAAGQSSTLAARNSPEMNFGACSPCSMNHISGVNQNGQSANRVAHPTDQQQPLVITYTFSTTIREYFPPPRASIAVQDTQPSTMPVPAASSAIGQSRTFIDEDSRIDNDERARNTLTEITSMPVDTALTVQTPVVGDGVTGSPAEIPRDIEFSSIPNEPENDGDSDTERDEDDQRLLPDSFEYIDSDQQQGEATPNNETTTDIVQTTTTTSANATDVITEQAAATTSTNDPPSPEPSEARRNFAVFTEDASQTILSNSYAHPLVTDAPKVPSPVDSSEESDGETNT